MPIRSRCLPCSIRWPRVAPVSYATVEYHGIHTFVLVDGNGRRTPFRYQWEPHAGTAGLTDAEAAERPRDYLHAELSDRLAREPVQFRLTLQLAEADDPLDDPTAAWPADRPTISAGHLELTSLVDDRRGDCEARIFDPGNVVDGVEPSGDPILAIRSHAYGVSYAATSRRFVVPELHQIPVGVADIERHPVASCPVPFDRTRDNLESPARRDRREICRFDNETEVIDVLARASEGDQVDDCGGVDACRRKRRFVVAPLVDPHGSEAEFVAVEREGALDIGNVHDDVIEISDLQHVGILPLTEDVEAVGQVGSAGDRERQGDGVGAVGERGGDAERDGERTGIRAEEIDGSPVGDRACATPTRRCGSAGSR